MQIDVVCRDREVRGKETERLFEDGSLFCLVTDHTEQSLQSSSSLQGSMTKGQRPASDQTATTVDLEENISTHLPTRKVLHMQRHKMEMYVESNTGALGCTELGALFDDAGLRLPIRLFHIF